MAERLTKKINKTIQDKYSLGSYLYYDFNGAENTNRLLNKLGELEDILEKYGIEGVEELECLIEQTPKFIVKETSEKYGQEINGVFFSNEQMLILSQYNELQEPYKKRYEQVKIDRDTWKRACELACEKINCSDNYGSKTYTIPPEKMLQYFYQQAKKESESK